MNLNALLVRYIVDDVDAAIAFYKENLGFHVTAQSGPYFAILTRENMQLVLSPRKGPGGGSQPMPVRCLAKEGKCLLNPLVPQRQCIRIGSSRTLRSSLSDTDQGLSNRSCDFASRVGCRRLGFAPRQKKHIALVVSFRWIRTLGPISSILARIQ